MSHPILSTEAYTAGTAKNIRTTGRVPATIYGRSQKTQNISVDKQDFRRVYRTAEKATLIEVEVDGKKIPALIHIVDLHPILGDPIHIDFYAVNMNEEVHAVVPVHTVGTADAVKLLGGTLTTMTTEIEIKCLPKYLISSVEADISALKTFHDSITVGDIVFSKEITVITPADNVVASVAAPRTASASEEEESETEGEGEEEKAEGEEKKED